MGIGLAFVFYVIHMRFWIVPVCDPKTGKSSLWIGGSANRNRDAFEQCFNELVTTAEVELKNISKTSPNERVASVAEQRTGSLEAF
jgi:hypothetical protein